MNPVQKICEVSGLKMHQIAKKCGFTHQQVQSWHSGRTSIVFSTFIRICNTIGLHPSKVFEDYVNPESEDNTDLS